MKLSNLYLVMELIKELEAINDRKRMFQTKKRTELPTAIAEELEILHEREVEILNELKEL